MKNEIQEIINKLESSEQPFYEACEMLRKLIDDPWEPKRLDKVWYLNMDGCVCRGVQTDGCRLFGNEWPTEELAKTARDMTKRNNLILQYKQEKGFEDGEWVICKRNDGLWSEFANDMSEILINPELTFETKAQAQEVINALRLND